MFLPSLLIGFGSFPNVQSVPSNNYIPEEICMNFVTDFDSLSARHRRDADILLHVKDLTQRKVSAGQHAWKRERAYFLRQWEMMSIQRIMNVLRSLNLLKYYI